MGLSFRSGSDSQKPPTKVFYTENPLGQRPYFPRHNELLMPRLPVVAKSAACPVSRPLDGKRIGGRNSSVVMTRETQIPESKQEAGCDFDGLTDQTESRLGPDFEAICQTSVAPLEPWESRCHRIEGKKGCFHSSASNCCQDFPPIFEKLGLHGYAWISGIPSAV